MGSLRPGRFVSGGIHKALDEAARRSASDASVAEGTASCPETVRPRSSRGVSAPGQSYRRRAQSIPS